jgi:hypothetical protein
VALSGRVGFGVDAIAARCRLDPARHGASGCMPSSVDTTALPTTLDDLKPMLEQRLRESLGDDGCLSDIAECSLDTLPTPAVCRPFADFGYRLYTSASATAALRALLRCTLPGTSDTFEEVLLAIAQGSSSAGTPAQHHCYLVGGQVRDILRGVLSTDIDFNYSCTAREVALSTVSRSWPTKYKVRASRSCAHSFTHTRSAGDTCSLAPRHARTAHWCRRHAQLCTGR